MSATHPELSPPSRSGCVELISAVMAEVPGARGLVVFILDYERLSGAPCQFDPLQFGMLDRLAQRLSTCAEFWHRIVKGEHGELVVIAQGLVDSGTVLESAARLLHGFTEELSFAAEAFIGIAVYPKQGATAEELLLAAEKSLVDAKRNGPSRSGRGAFFMQA